MPRVVEDALMRRPPGDPGGSEAETEKGFRAWPWGDLSLWAHPVNLRDRAGFGTDTDAQIPQRWRRRII